MAVKFDLSLSIFDLLVFDKFTCHARDPGRNKRRYTGLKLNSTRPPLT